MEVEGCEGYEGPLAEFVALRQEMDSAGQRQLQVSALQLTVVGAVFSFVVSRRNLEGLMLIIPFSSFILCGRALDTHYGAQRRGRYIREFLAYRIPGGLHWEGWILENPRPGQVLGGWLPAILAFPGASLLALSWVVPSLFSPDEHSSVYTHFGLAGLWLAGLAVTGFMVFLLVRALRYTKAVADDRP